MTGFLHTIATGARNAKRNLIELFTGNTHEEIIDELGRKVIVINHFRLPDNPLPALRKLTRMEWTFFAWGFFTLFVDVFNFSCLTIQTTKLAEHFNATKSQITMAITYTLLSKFLGALLFGLASDTMGRKYPMILNLLFLAASQLATTYTNTLRQFQISRIAFGIAMGGIWGNSAASALEHSSYGARGTLSGVFESSACVAYLVANGINLLLGVNPANWRTLFYIGSSIALVAALFRLCLPESAQFVTSYDDYDDSRESKVSRKVKVSIILRQLAYMARHDWPTILYCLVLTSLICGVATSAADPYIILLMADKGMTFSEASKVAMIVSVGGIFGGPVIGCISQTIGRRRALVFSGIVICALIPWGILPTNRIILTIGGFLGTFFVLPIHLNELAEPKFRTLVPGIVFQIGFAMASPLPQLIVNLAERTKVVRADGRVQEDFSRISAAFVATCALLMILWAAIGPERRGSRFETVAPAGIERKERMEPMKRILVFGNQSSNQNDGY